LRTHAILPASVRPDTNNPGLTVPRTFGVWELPANTGSKRYRYGNNPVRESELTREYGAAKRIALYTDRDAAKSHASEMNQ